VGGHANRVRVLIKNLQVAMQKPPENEYRLTYRRATAIANPFGYPRRSQLINDLGALLLAL
jgi:hypothetical protein